MFKPENAIENGKYLCPECGSKYKIDTQSHNRHIKSKTHLKAIGKEDEFDGDSQKAYSQQFRTKLKRELGETEYKKLETQERARRRAKETKETKPVEPKPNKTRYEDILEKFKKASPNLMDKTIEKNLKNLGLVYKKLYNKDYDYSNITFLTTKPVDTIKKLVKIYKDENKSEKTISNLLGSIASILRSINKDTLEETIDIYSKASILLQKRVEKELDTGDLKEKQKDWLNWSEVKSLKTNIDEYGTPLDRGLYHLYTDIAPRRIIDYSMMKVVKSDDEFVVLDDDKFNYLIVDEELIPQQMIISRYKSPAKKKWSKELGTDGTYTLDISDPLQDNLDQYLGDQRVKMGGFLFSKENGKPYTESEFSKLISEMLNKYSDTNMTLNSLRHSYASHHLKKAKNMKQKKKIAWEMGSSVDTLMKNYDKHEMN